MVKGLIVCNPKSGKGKVIKYSKKIKESLKDIYECDILISDTLEMLEKALIEDIKNYEFLLICGGDGTFHQCINYLCKTPYRPKIGYIPLGTACDTGKNLGMSKSIKKSLEIIKKGNTRIYPIMKANDTYVCYAMATGKFVSTSFLTNRKLKYLGPIGYLVIGLLEMFTEYNLKLYVDDYIVPRSYNARVLCILNTKSIGSITLKQHERKMVIIHRNVIWALASIVLRRGIITRKNVTVLPLDKNYIVNIGKTVWSVDGEKKVFEGDIRLTYNACEFECICK